MRFGLSITNFGEYFHPSAVAKLASLVKNATIFLTPYLHSNCISKFSLILI
ncbi:MAG: hypothetical protein BAJALOKI1v1_2130002 [Promethearchaeota archaeon]|nr:MAG: hypothetical protein BAJALOKI1v1_2130002 [Candidatus Lokiarchaeota archaeon]